MKTNDIITEVNKNLNGERLNLADLKTHLDAVIGDINDALSACYPTFTEAQTLPGFDGNYNFFPDHYVRTVVVIGTAFKYYQNEEEGETIASEYSNQYQLALFTFKRDFLGQVPEIFLRSNGGYLDMGWTPSYAQQSTGGDLTSDLFGGRDTTTLIGPMGPRGSTGLQGNVGPQGPKGDKGDTGAMGPRGFDGSTGAQGIQGEQGPQGVAGEKGEVGETGPQGLQGAKGSQWCGAYSAAINYSIDDVVSYLGSSYICILASLGNLPTNATYWSVSAQAGSVNETQLATKADKVMATNIIQKGDMSDVSKWASPYGTVSVASNEVSCSATNLTGNFRIQQNTLVQTITGHKYYARFSIFPKYANLTKFIYGSANNFLINLIANVWNNCSLISTATDSISTTAYFYHDTATSYVVGDSVKWKYASIIDLTAIFGAGNEPTLSQMDALMARFPNSWFNGTSELFGILALQNLKASVKQEDWICPTLLNSWVLLNAAIPVQYRKDQFGKVTLKGIVKSGTIGSGTPIFTLPIGYRPPNDFYASTLSNSLFGQIYISTAGNVCALTGSTANFGLYNIEFYVS